MQRDFIEEQFLKYLRRDLLVLHFKFKSYIDYNLKSTKYERILNYSESIKENKKILLLDDEDIYNYEGVKIIEYDYCVIPPICIKMNENFGLEYLMTDNILLSIISERNKEDFRELKRIPYLKK